MRILEKLNINYRTFEYEDNTDHKLEFGAAERIAEKAGAAPESVFKTIVMRTETKELCVFCESAIHEINLKKARTAAGAKEIDPVKPDELLQLTGYVRGGCWPLGMKRKYRTFIDTCALDCEKIYISAGVRGEQIIIKPENLIKACDAVVCDLVL